MNRTIHLYIPALLLLCSVHLHAQQDVRITPPEPSYYSLPQDIRIQSAATVGTTTLVAWGALSRYDTLYVPEIVVQRVEKTQPIGSPIVVHSRAARPHDVVSVIGLDDRFVVIWQDKRSVDSGIYARVIGLDGSFQGSEELLALGGQLKHDTLVWLMRRPGGYGIVWLDSTSGIARFEDRLIGTDGHARGASGHLASIDTDDTLRYSAFPGCWIGRDTTGGVHYEFHYADGRTDDRRIDQKYIELPHYLNADTSIALLAEDTLRRHLLILHPSLFDTTVSRQVVTPFTPPTYYDPPTFGVVLGRDSAGNYVVIVGESRDIDYTGFGYRKLVYFRVTLFADDSSSDPDAVDTLFGGMYAFSPGIGAESKLQWVRYIPGDNNSCRVTGKYDWVSTDKNSGTSSSGEKIASRLYDSNAMLRTVIELNGRFLDSNIRNITNTSRPNCCATSMVNVTIVGTDVVVEAPVVPTEVIVRKYHPIIIERDGKLVLTWQRQANVHTFGYGMVEQGLDTPLVGSIDIIPDKVGSYDNQTPHTLFQNRVTERFVDAGSNASTISYVRSYYVGSSAAQTLEFDTRCYIATDSTLMTDTTFVLHPVHNATLDGIVASFNPNTRETLFSFNVSGLGRYIEVANVKGKKTSNGVISTSLINPFSIVFVGTNEYLSIEGYQARHVRNGAVIVSFSFPTTGEDAPASNRFYRLLGDRFLRIYPIKRRLNDTTLADSTVQLEVYDLRGRLKGSCRKKGSSNDYTIAYAERASDSAIALLWGGKSGLHLTMLSHNLDLLLEDTVISEGNRTVSRPSGVFKGDTLYAVWEDTRNRGIDIYGTSLSLDWIHGTERPPGESAIVSNEFPLNPRGELLIPVDTTTTEPPRGISVAIGSIRPNPSLENTLLRVDLPDATPIQIDLVDAAGRLVRHEERGNYPRGISDIAIDLRDLHPGAFLIRLHTNQGETTTRIVVLH